MFSKYNCLRLVAFIPYVSHNSYNDKSDFFHEWNYKASCLTAGVFGCILKSWFFAVFLIDDLFWSLYSKIRWLGLLNRIRPSFGVYIYGTFDFRGPWGRISPTLFSTTRGNQLITVNEKYVVWFNRLSLSYSNSSPTIIIFGSCKLQHEASALTDHPMFGLAGDQATGLPSSLTSWSSIHNIINLHEPLKSCFEVPFS